MFCLAAISISGVLVTMKIGLLNLWVSKSRFFGSLVHSFEKIRNFLIIDNKSFDKNEVVKNLNYENNIG